MNDKVQIRNANIDDLPAIVEIYNEAILNTTATFDTEPKTPEEQSAWFSAHNEKRPIMVAEHEGRILGWSSLNSWSDRCAYSDTVEFSVYIDAKERGKGIGKSLMSTTIEFARGAKDIHTILVRIVGGNDVSIKMHESFGFKHIGIMREVGKKFGKLMDVHMMQLIF